MDPSKSSGSSDPNSKIEWVKNENEPLGNEGRIAKSSFTWEKQENGICTGSCTIEVTVENPETGHLDQHEYKITIHNISEKGIAKAEANIVNKLKDIATLAVMFNLNENKKIHHTSSGEYQKQMKNKEFKKIEPDILQKTGFENRSQNESKKNNALSAQRIHNYVQPSFPSWIKNEEPEYDEPLEVPKHETPEGPPKAKFNEVLKKLKEHPSYKNPHREINIEPPKTEFESDFQKMLKNPPLRKTQKNPETPIPEAPKSEPKLTDNKEKVPSSFLDELQKDPRFLKAQESENEGKVPADISTPESAPPATPIPEAPKAPKPETKLTDNKEKVPLTFVDELNTRFLKARESENEGEAPADIPKPESAPPVTPEREAPKPEPKTIKETPSDSKNFANELQEKIKLRKQPTVPEPEKVKVEASVKKSEIPNTRVAKLDPKYNAVINTIRNAKGGPLIRDLELIEKNLAILKGNSPERKKLLENYKKITLIALSKQTVNPKAKKDFEKKARFDSSLITLYTSQLNRQRIKKVKNMIDIACAIQNDFGLEAGPLFKFGVQKLKVISEEEKKLLKKPLASAADALKLLEVNGFYNSKNEIPVLNYKEAAMKTPREATYAQQHRTEPPFKYDRRRDLGLLLERELKYERDKKRK